MILTKKLALAFFLLWSVFPAKSQKIDSLKKIIDANVGQAKIEPIIEMARHWVLTDNHEALKWVKQASEIAVSTGDTANIVRTSRMVCQLHNRLSMDNESEKLLLKILPVARRHNLRVEHKKILNLLGIMFIFQAKYDQALRVFVEALGMHEEDRDLDGVSIIQSNMGLLYYKLKDYDKSLMYISKSMDLKKQINQLYNFDLLLGNLSLCYAFKKDYLTAKIFADSAMKECGGHLCNDNRKLENNYSLGIIHLGLKDISKANDHFLESYAIASRINNIRFQLDNIINLTEISILQNDGARATTYLKEAEELMDAGVPFKVEMIKIYGLFLKLYDRKKDYAKVTYYQQKYIQLKDSTYDEQLTNNLMRIEAEYLERENSARITTQRQTIALKEEIIKEKQLLNIITGILTIVLVLLAMILVVRYRNKQKLNNLLDENVDERTRELQQTHEDLMRMAREREIHIARFSEDINRSMATINGLCAVGLQDVSDPEAKKYILKLHATSNELTGTIKGLQSLRTIY
jgi:tetratricopeptide (TPR) repeat protein